jgi:hypothetical protein
MARKKATRTGKVRVFRFLSEKHESDLIQAKMEMSKRFLPRPETVAVRLMAFRAMAPNAKSANASNVVGVGVDEKYADGIPTGVQVVKFLVKSKLPKTSLTRAEMLPASVNGVETDVEEVGALVPLAKKTTRKAGASANGMPNPRTRIRPAQPGSSIGFRDPNDKFVMAGTFGALVKDARGAVYILSNNHVLANESGINAAGEKIVGLPPGSPIFQPGLLDGGQDPADAIAELTRWVDLRAGQTDNAVDGAIAKVLHDGDVSRDILMIGAPQGTSVATKDMVVHKFGRTTAYRAGRVSSVLFDVRLTYAVGDVTFADQIAIRGLDGQPFSAAGDSGSAILERETNKIVGLLFAGATNNSVTFGNHIADVLKQLNVSLV